MNCPVCGTLNIDEAVFCKQCGSELRQSECPHCKAAIEPGAQFCPMCGTRLLEYEEEAGRTCQSCGFLNPAGTLYCKRCNQKIL
jgi:ribosomal protein L40E